MTMGYYCKFSDSRKHIRDPNLGSDRGIGKQWFLNNVWNQLDSFGVEGRSPVFL